MTSRRATDAHPALVAAGPWDRREFAALRADVDPRNDWPTARTLSDALHSVEKLSAPPELILLAQPRPGLHEQSDVERWRSAFPLTRIVVIAGSWCEGELRTGRPLAGVIRLYWHEFPAWWGRALERRAAGKAPPWSAPLVDARAGQSIEVDDEVVNDSAASPPRILAVDAVDYAVFESLEAALAPFRWRCHWQPRHRPELQRGQAAPAAGLWDGGQLDDAERRDLAQFCARLAERQAPVVALVDFPRADNLECAQSAGAAAVLGKPYSVAALGAELSGPR